MIVSRTPLRISFVGGGSDLPSFYRHLTGAVVTAAIDKYIYINVNKKFDRKIRASYSITEIVDSVDELKNELIRKSLKLVGPDAGIEVTSISDILSEGTGLGSSSAHTVGLLNALHALAGRHAGAERLAREASCIEIERCGKPKSLEKMVHLARELREALCQNDADSFGEILHQGWMTKKTLAAKISNNRIDEWYDRARCHGAIGGKILGAGGGGFLLLYAPPERHQGILAALPEQRPVPVGFEPQGSKIIYVEEAP
jgi:galactokinase/mevalonate kinase-like predicted kinase